MAGEVSITCPNCKARLKLKDSSKLGQRIGCPKCKQSFTTVAPSDDGIDLDELASLSGEIDQNDLPPVRLSTSRSSATLKSGGASSPGGNNMPLIAGGVGAAVIVIGVVIWLGSGRSHEPAVDSTPGVAQPNPTPANPTPANPPAAQLAATPPVVATRPNKLDVTWLPPQSAFILYIRPADILASPFLNWAVDAGGGRAGMKEGLESVRKELGVSFDDVESITVGIKNLAELSSGTGPLGPGAMMNPMALSMQAATGMQQLGTKEIAGVVRLKKPLDLTKVAKFQQEAEPVSYNGVTYHRHKATAGKPSGEVVYQPSPTIVVLTGREDLLKSAIDRKGQADLRSEIAMIDPSQHLVIAVVPERPTLLDKPPAPDNPMEAAMQLVQGFAFGLKATDGIEGSLSQSSKSALDAQQISAAVQDLVKQGKEQLAAAKATLPPNVAQLAETLLGSVKWIQQEGLVNVSFKLPQSSRENLQAAAGEAMMLVMGGLAGGLNAGQRGLGVGGEGAEGAPVTVDRLKGLPEGVSLQARARWSPFTSFSADGTPKANPLQLELTFLGEPVARTISLGQLRMTDLMAEPPTRLKRVGSGFGLGDPERGFVDAEQSEMKGGPPAQGAKLRLDFVPPSVPVSRFAKVEGTIALRVAETSKNILLPDVMSQVDKPVKDRDLLAAGFTAKTDTDFGMKRVVFKFHPDASVGEVKFVSATGHPVENAPMLSTQQQGNDRSYVTMLDDKGLPAGTGLRIVLHTKVKEMTVPFKFTDVPIPPRTVIPQPDGDSWTTTTRPADLPRGLAVEGKLHWPQWMSFDKDGKRLPPGIGLAVDVTGPQALRTTGIGFWKIRNMRPDSGSPPVLRKENGPGQVDPTRQYVSTGSALGVANHPPDGIQAWLAFDGAPTFRQLTVDGSFKLAIYKEKKTVRIDKLTTRIGKLLPGAELRPLGVELKLTKQGKTLTLQVTKGNPLAVADLKIIREKPPEKPDAPWNLNPAEKSGYLFVNDDRFGTKDALEVTVYGGLEEIEVPFAFENLTVPPAPKQQ